MIIVGSRFRTDFGTACDLLCLAGLPWVLHTPDANARCMIDQPFTEAGLTPVVAIEENNVEAIDFSLNRSHPRVG